MTETEVRDAYRVLYKFITAERMMRVRVFPEGSTGRKKKLADCDAAMAAATLLKDFCKEHLPATHVQEALLDVPEVKKKIGGY